jgi:Na+/H+ antiporter NhaD/arsenite permease-like protein
MFSVLSMQPEMPPFQWLLVTLTCGVGGSLLSVGSAAGVALMGTSQGRYTFLSHLRWTPLIAVGYVAGIGTHFLVNG